MKRILKGRFNIKNDSDITREKKRKIMIMNLSNFYLCENVGMWCVCVVVKRGMSVCCINICVFC